MKAIFDKSELSAALDRVQRAAQTKINSNTNNGFFFAAKDGQVELQANDYTIGIKTTCAASVEEEGILVIAAPQLLTTIRMMPAGNITMEQKKGENTVTFTSGSYISKFPTRDMNEFPEVKEIGREQHAIVRTKDMADMTNLVAFATATDKQKPLFTGVLFEIHDSLFAMAATNTHRLANKEVSLEEAAPAAGRFIVPANILSDVVRMLPQEEEDTVEISWANNHVAFTFGTTYFVSNLINGDYPDYHRVIPTRFDATATLNRRDFEEAVRFVSPISRDVNYQTINFHFSGDTLEVFEEDPQIGRSDTSIPVQLEGDDLSITFNCNYIEDILKHSSGETVILHLQRSGPMLVEQEEDKTYQYVVTPMRGRN